MPFLLDYVYGYNAGVGSMSRIQLAEMAYYEKVIIKKKALLSEAKSSTSKAYLQLGIDHSIDALQRIKAGMVVR